MAKDSTVLGNFHRPSSDKHPKESLGNQQVFDQGKQVGSLEYIPDAQGNMKIQLNNSKGKDISNL